MGHSNDSFKTFKFIELLGRTKCDEELVRAIKKVTQTEKPKRASDSFEARQQALSYKMLKCDAKLIRFLFELNGFVHTDRHDWNVLWTHTQGKSYFYERLGPN